MKNTCVASALLAASAFTASQATATSTFSCEADRNSLGIKTTINLTLGNVAASPIVHARVIQDAGLGGIAEEELKDYVAQYWLDPVSGMFGLKIIDDQAQYVRFDIVANTTEKYGPYEFIGSAIFGYANNRKDIVDVTCRFSG